MNTEKECGADVRSNDSLGPVATNRDRPTSDPGGCECEECGAIFIGADWHTLCAICFELVDDYGNPKDGSRIINCCFPDCGCDGARLCMAENGASWSARAINIERGSV